MEFEESSESDQEPDIWFQLLYVPHWGDYQRNIYIYTYMAFHETRIVAFKVVHNGYVIDTFSAKVHRNNYSLLLNNNTVREVMIALEGLSHRRHNPSIQADGVALNLDIHRTDNQMGRP